MRIGINGRFLIARRTGVQRAAYNLIKNLVQLDRENEYFLFTHESQRHSPEWQYPNVRIIPSEIQEGDNLRNHLWEQFTLPRLAKLHGVDLLHSPANTAPLFYKGKSVIHIHDLCFVVNPQWYSFTFRTVYNLLIPRLAKRATKIITNSNNSKNDLLKYCDLAADRVSLIYWAVDDTFTAAADPKQEEPVADAGYILYVGSLEPRKNITALLKGYEYLREKYPQLKTKLVLIGGESPLFANVRLSIKLYKDDIIFKGFVTDKELRQAYRDASVVAYPSLYEGFGLPPLEAMACGTPVVTSSTSSLPEVVGDSALMVSPHDYQRMGEMLAKVLLDKDLAAELRSRGLERVKRFNWVRVARETLSVFYEVGLSSDRDRLSYLPFERWQLLNQLEVSGLAGEGPPGRI